MASQTVYLDNMPAGEIGSQATELHADFISRSNEDTATIAFGVPVYQGTNDKGITATAGTVILGISSRTRSVRAETPNGYGKYDTARVQTSGDIWVQASVAVNAGDPVYATTAGAWVKTSGGGNILLAGARYETSTGGAGLAVIRW